MKYVMMTAKEVIEKLAEMPYAKRSLDFTFDDLNTYPEEEPCEWHGIRQISIFDEDQGCIVIGYYGGGSTVLYELGEVCGKSVIEFCIEKLQEYMNYNYGSGKYCEKICVEIQEEE